jgi:ABC-type cobalamin/Fe3+-siderophores transport system ATPase subunit
MTKKTKYIENVAVGMDINTAINSAAKFVVVGDGYSVLHGK